MESDSEQAGSCTLFRSTALLPETILKTSIQYLTRWGAGLKAIDAPHENFSLHFQVQKIMKNGHS